MWLRTMKLWFCANAMHFHLFTFSHFSLSANLVVQFVYITDHIHVSDETCSMQILEATAYMHKQGIIHRDLKPENIMFAQDVETNIESEDLLKAFNVKVIDLGMSAYYEPNNPLKGNNYCTTNIGFTASCHLLACATYCAYAGWQHALS